MDWIFGTAATAVAVVVFTECKKTTTWNTAHELTNYYEFLKMIVRSYAWPLVFELKKNDSHRIRFVLFIQIENEIADSTDK